MSSKRTILLTNDKNEEAFFDSNTSVENNEGQRKDELTLEFHSDNIRVESEEGDTWLVFTLTNVDSEMYKIFERLGEIAPEENK